MKRRALPARAAYALVILLATWSEPTLQAGSYEWTERLMRALSFEVPRSYLVDGVRNIVLFLGWGAVWTITSPMGPGWPIILRATASGALVSLAAEALQLASPVRVPGLLDVITNTAGAFIGAFVLAVLIVLLRAGRGQRSYLGIPMVLIAGGYCGAMLLEAALPLFRQERLTGSWGTPLERFDLAMRLFEWSSLWQLPLFDFVLFLPAGFLAVAALGEFGIAYGRAALRVTLAAIPLAIVAELARGFMGYPIEAGAMLLHALAIGAGAWLGARGLPAITRAVRGAERPLVFFLLYAVLMAFWTLRPFLPEVSGAQIAEKVTIERFIPLQSYRERVDVFSAADAMIPALLLLPIGALLAAWPIRRKGMWSAFWPAVYLMAVLEVGQILIIGRYFDITDLLIAFAALGLGWSAARRAGYQPYGEVAAAWPDTSAVRARQRNP